jgi:hypothetical protein
MNTAIRPAAKWAAQNPDVAQWVKEHRESSSFANSLIDYARLHGRLTANQENAVRKIIAQNKETPTVDVARLKSAFAAARASGLRRLSITMGPIVVKPASETSANAGSLYVTDDAGVYLGKIVSGAFRSTRVCTPEQRELVARLVSDPRAAVEAYGIESGVCCICNRELTDPVSVARGIGPVCATRFGW